MQRVEGVQAAKVSLKDGLTVLDLKPSNSITLARLREIIKNNGFVSKEAVIVAAGTTQGSGTSTTFVVSGTGERLPVTGATTDAGQGLSRITSPAK